MAVSSSLANSKTRSAFAVPAGILLAGMGFFWLLYIISPRFMQDHFVMLGVVVGLVVYMATLADCRLGLIAVIMAIGVSPEFKIMGIPNFRLEDFLIPVVVVSWATRLVDRKSALKEFPLRQPLIAVIVTWMISLVYGMVINDGGGLKSFLYFAKYLEYFLLMILVHQNLNNEEEIHITAMVMIIVSLLVGAQGFGGVLLADASPGSENLIQGPEGETRNVLGGYLVFHVLLCFGIALFYNDLRWRILMVLVIIFLGIPISMTFSRTSYIALFGALGIFLMYKRRGLILPFFVMMVFLPALVSDPVRDRASTILEIFGDRPPSSWVVRVDSWQMAYRTYFLSSPLFGFGPGYLVPGQVDNEYMFILVNSGLLGLGALLWLLARIFQVLLRILDYADSLEPFSRAFALGYMAGFFGCLIHAISAPTLTAIRTAEMFYLATGILLAVYSAGPCAAGDSGGEGRSHGWLAASVPSPVRRREPFFPL